MRFVLNYLKTPQWRRQISWRRAIWTAVSKIGLTGVHGLPLNRDWIDLHRRAMRLPGLDPAMNGAKIVQISDLHYSPVVWEPYLAQFMDWVNDQEPDLVVVTGDLITGGYRYASRVSGILKRLQPRQGVVCTLGNHDYGMFGRNVPKEGFRRAEYLQKSLQDSGMTVLRNETMQFKTPAASKPVNIVGLDDEWSGNIDPERAFEGIDSSLPTICLNHNPANCPTLVKYPWQWMLSGHTHGRQLATTTLGKKFYPHLHRHYTRGYYPIHDRHLYVNRGLAYGQRVQRWCRPEITVLRMQPAS